MKAAVSGNTNSPRAATARGSDGLQAVEAALHARNARTAAPIGVEKAAETSSLNSGSLPSRHTAPMMATMESAIRSGDDRWATAMAAGNMARQMVASWASTLRAGNCSHRSRRAVLLALTTALGVRMHAGPLPATWLAMRGSAGTTWPRL